MVTSEYILQDKFARFTRELNVGGEMNWEFGIDIYTLLILCVK